MMILDRMRDNRIYVFAKDCFARQPAMTLFILISLCFGLLFVIKTPPLWGADETTHYARAYDIAQGKWRTQQLDYPWGSKSYGNDIPVSLYDLIWHVNDDITVDKNITNFGVKHIDNIDGYESYVSQKLNNPQTEKYFYPNTAAYSPVAYVPSALAIKASMVLDLTLGQSIIFARLLGLFFYIACIAFVLRALRETKFAWLLFAVALIPMNLFEASIICTDLTVNALAIVVVGLVAKVLLQKSLTRSEMIVVGTAAAVLPIVKPTYVFISGLLLLLPHGLIRQYMNPWLYKGAFLGAGLSLLLLWTYATREVAVAFRLIGTGDRWQYISISQQTEFLLQHPLGFITAMGRTILLQDNTFLQGMFGALSFHYIQVPAISLLAGILALLLGVGMMEKIKLLKYQMIYTVLLLVGGIGALFGSFYLTFSNVADPIVQGVQGRYFLPFLPLFFFLIAVVMPKKSFIRMTPAVAQNIIVGLCVLSLTVMSLKFFYVMLG